MHQVCSRLDGWHTRVNHLECERRMPAFICYTVRIEPPPMQLVDISKARHLLVCGI